ncbi:alcohol dehydrogenase [Stutzerimonas stutzeri]|jgi:2-desacetyl-2-hydroxyethyl bacteriochlorophyllide A dehydrogenase|nr:alcohol dehydrogenase [Stutzerimonas stutzeri]
MAARFLLKRHGAAMKQIRMYGPQDLRIDDVPRPVAGPRDVVVKVAMFGICGSDLAFARDGYIGRPTGQAIPLGHELAGTVFEVGSEVSGIRSGQRVVIHPMKSGNRIGTGDPEHGGFAEYLLVREAVLGDSIFPIDDSLSFDRAVLTEPIAVGMHGLNLGDVQAGDHAVVFGAGPIGLGAIAALKYRGAARVVAIDVVEERLERARQLGADLTINPAKEDVRATLEERLGTVKSMLTGLPLVDAGLYVDCAGHAPLLQQAVEMAKEGARIVILAKHKTPVSMDMVQVMSKELTVRGSLSYPTEFSEVIAMLGDTGLDMGPMVSHMFPFEQFEQAFATAQNAQQSAKVLVSVE